jgi:hypothetical protein
MFVVLEQAYLIYDSKSEGMERAWRPTPLKICPYSEVFPLLLPIIKAA